MKQKHWQVSVFDKTSETIRDDTFYTTDTEAYLIFELIDEDFTPDSATVTVYNVYGKATINANVEVADGIVRYEMPVDAIGHPGGWRTQVIFTKDNEDYTTKIIEFEVGGHLLDNKKPSIVDIENWNSFIAYARELIDDWEQLEVIRQANEQQRELAESARQNEFETNETSRQANELVREEAENNRQSTFEANETERQTEFEENEQQRQDNYQELLDTGVLQTNINTKLEQLEEEYTPKLTGLTAQLQQTEQTLNGRVDTIIGLPEGSTTNDARLEDIKVGADGKTYDSPGTAVRQQIGNIKDDTETLQTTIKITDAVGTAKTRNTKLVISGKAGDIIEFSLKNYGGINFSYYQLYLYWTDGQNRAADIDGVNRFYDNEVYRYKLIKDLAEISFYMVLSDYEQGAEINYNITKFGEVRHDVEKLKTTVSELKIPEKTSDLINDAGFVTEADDETTPAADDSTTTQNLFKAMRKLKAETAHPSNQISIPNNTGSVIKDASIRLALHKGQQEGNVVWNEVFSETFKNDFSGLRFFDGDSELPYTIHSHGNYDFIKDTNVGFESDGIVHFSDGMMVKSTNMVVKTSVDNGATWTDIISNAYARFIDKNDNLYIQTIGNTDPALNNVFYRYSKGDYTNGTKILDLSTMGEYINATIPRWGEDDAGNVYMGRYQESWSGAVIYKIAPGASSFVSVYENLSAQHVHHITIDKNSTPNAIYAGLDNSSTADNYRGPYAIRSLDRGATWEELPVPYRNRDFCWTYVGKGFALGGGEANILGGLTLYRTTDVTDGLKTKVAIGTTQGIRSIVSPDDGKTILVGGVASKTNLTEQLYASTDNGKTWETIWANDIEKYKGGAAGNGVRVFTDYFQPLGATEKQMIACGYNRNYGLRIYFGGDRHFGLCYVNVGDIPIGGKTITLDPNYIMDASEQSETITPDIIKPIWHLALNEGDGQETVLNETQVIDLSSALVTWDKVRYDDYTEIVPAIARNNYAAILDNTSAVKVGTIPIDKVRDFTIAFTIKMPKDPLEIRGANYSTQPIKYLLHSNAIKIFIQGDRIGFDFNGTVSVPQLIGEEVWAFDEYRRYVFTVNSEELPIVTSYFQNFPQKISKVSRWGDVSMKLSDHEYTLGNGISVYDRGLCDIKFYDKCLTQKEVTVLNNGRNYAYMV